MRIGELVKITGVAAHTIRRLVEQGAIPAKRNPHGRASWRFAKTDIPRIVKTLTEFGMIEDGKK